MPLAGTVSSFAVLLAAAAPLPAEDWRLLMRTDSYAAGVDAASIRTGGAVAAGRLITAPLGEAENPNEVRAMAVMDIEIDCAARRKRVVERRIVDLEGNELLHSTTADAGWEVVPRGSPVAALQAVLCDAKPLDKPGAPDAPSFARLWASTSASGR